MSTLYLHIGTPKTATTAIQGFCRDNDAALRKRGFTYPIFDYKYPNASLARNGRFLVGICKDQDGNRDRDEEERRYTELTGKILELFKEVPNVILSDEGIWRQIRFEENTHWKNLKELGDANGFDVKIIVYVRAQDDFVISWWKQQIKEDYKTKSALHAWDPDFLCSRTALDYYENLEKVAAIYGKENIVVRLFDRKAFEGEQHTIQSDFFKVLGLTIDEDYQMKAQERNLTLTGNMHEIKRIINELPAFNQDTAPEVRKTATICSQYTDPEFKYSMFSQEEQKAFMDRFAESNGKIAREYMGKEDGILFQEKQITDPKYDPDNPYMYADMIRYFGEAQLRLVKQNQELKTLVKECKATQKKMQKQIDNLNKRLSLYEQSFAGRAVRHFNKEKK